MKDAREVAQSVGEAFVWDDLAGAVEAIESYASEEYLRGRREALEEAAVTCDAVAARWATFHNVAPAAAKGCAKEIRALKGVDREEK